MTTLARRLFFNPEKPLVSIDVTLLLFRVLWSLSLLHTHGLKKLLNFEETVAHIPDPFGMGGVFNAYIAVVANIVCPVLIILGLGTRLAILPILGLTSVGFFVVHAQDPWVVRDVPLMYFLAFCLLFILGPGRYSLDAYLKKCI
jgi:putative oxidoreductase